MLKNVPNDIAVRIPKGDYLVNLPIIIKGRQGLVLLFEEGSRVFGALPDMPLIIIEGSANITIKNLAINYVNKEEPTKLNIDGTAMIHIRNSSDIVLDNCELNGGVSVGIGAFKTDTLTINRSEIRNFKAVAFRFEQCGVIQILQSLIENNGSLMKAGGIASLVMSDNLERNNGGYYTKGKAIPAPGTVKKQSLNVENMP